MTNSGSDDEVSLDLELTGTGVRGKARARSIGIFQRWLGSKFALAIAKNNRATAREQVLGALEKKGLQQIGAEALETLRSSPAAIDSLLDTLQLPGVARQYENSSAVLAKAIEDLSTNPPSDEETLAGADEISPEVADRLQHYASGASTDEIRERWGRVLAAEIRRPGTFSLKVLRIIDELDSELPKLFEDVATNRFENGTIPRCLFGKLSYSNQIELVDSGLLHDPGTGEAFAMRVWSESQLSNDELVWATGWKNTQFAIPRKGEFGIEFRNGEMPIVNDGNGKPATPVYLLTNAGKAIANILSPVDNKKRYLALLRADIPDARLWQRPDESAKWIEVDPLPPKSLPDLDASGGQ